MFEIISKQIAIGTLGIIVALDIFLTYLLFWKYTLKYSKEIRLVGFRNWVWFVCILKRNEFHSSLDYPTNRLLSFSESVHLVQKRNLAHQLDEKLEDYYAKCM